MHTRLILLLTVLFLFSAAAMAAPGDFDATFGTDGVSTSTSAGLDLAGACLAIDDSGNIVLAGSSADSDDAEDLNPMLVLFNSTGSERDAYFSGPGGEEYFSGCGFDSENRFYATGTTNINGTHDVFIMRFRPITEAQFEIDTTFQNAGTVITDLNSGSVDDVLSAKIDSEDRLVVGGVTDTGGENDFFVARFDSSGNLDTSFGTSGKTITDPNMTDAFATDLALGQNGEIALVGLADGNIVITVYTSEGLLDTGFDTDGLATIDVGSSTYDVAAAVAFDGDDLIVVGQTNISDIGDVVVVRYNYNADAETWSRDTDFGSDGIADFSVGSATTDIPLGVAIDSESRILMTGYSESTSGTSIFVARLDSDGTLDSAFGDNGVAIWTDASESLAYDIITTDNDQILIAGSAVLTTSAALVARLDNSDAGDDADATPSSAGCALAANSTAGGLVTLWQGALLVCSLMVIIAFKRRRALEE